MRSHRQPSSGRSRTRAAAARSFPVWMVCLAGALTVSGCASQKAARLQGNETAEQLADRARAAADRGDPESAEVLLTAAVNTNPGDCETRLELSEMLLEHGSISAATDHLRRLVNQNPDDPRARVKLARALYLQNDAVAAERLLERALELDPENPQAWLLQAHIENGRHDSKQALIACYRALASDPENSDARLLAAEIHLREGDRRQALPLVHSVLENTASCPRQRQVASWVAGRCYAQEGRWPEAATALAAALRDRPNATADDWYQLAYARFRAGDLSGSRQAVDLALNLSPDDSESLTLSRLLETSVTRAAGASDAHAPPPQPPQAAPEVAKAQTR